MSPEQYAKQAAEQIARMRAFVEQKRASGAIDEETAARMLADLTPPPVMVLDRASRRAVLRLAVESGCDPRTVTKFIVDGVEAVRDCVVRERLVAAAARLGLPNNPSVDDVEKFVEQYGRRVGP